MKKIITLILALALVFALAGCASNNNAPAETQAPTEAPAASTDAPASGGKTLVVYFSGSGHTRDLAEEIANKTGADIFEITPAEPYTDDDLNWNVDNSRVNREHEDESLQNVELTTTEVPDWDSYDTVFFGYPIWWGNAAWPVNGFVTANDFSGKTVIPFCSSFSSGIGNSAKNLEQLAGTGTWLDGQRFGENASASDVDEWIDGLGLD